MNRKLNVPAGPAGYLLPLVFLAAALLMLPQAPAQAPSLDDALKAISTYEFGQTREPLTVVSDMVKASYGNAAKRAEIEQKFDAMLGSDASFYCKDFICRQLNVIGTEASVPALEPMLTDEKYSDMARYALEGIKGQAVDNALTAALDKTTGRLKIGMIDSMGVRRGESSVPALVPLLKNPDDAVAQAAAAALGHIGGVAAAEALMAARASVPAPVKQAVDDGCLMCAAQYNKEGQKEKAQAIYTALNTPDVSRQTRIAAIEGTVAVQGKDALPALMDLLKGDNPELQAIAAGSLRTLEGADVTKTLADALPSLNAHGQLLTLYALRQRADRAALPAVTAAAQSADADVRVAALEALASVGDASSVPLLVSVATSSDADAAHAASASLDALRGNDVDGAIISALKASSGTSRVELIRSLAARGSKDAVATLLQTAADADDAVRTKSFDALASLASVEQLPTLISLLVQMNGNSAQSAAEGAVVAVAQKIQPANQRAQSILSAMGRLKGKPEIRASFVHVLGRIGDSSALPELRRIASQDRDGAVAEAAIRALADWPTAETMDDLAKLAASAPDNALKTVAFQGYIRELRLLSDRPIEQTLKLYGDAVKLAKTADDKRLVLAGLAEIHDSRALTLVEPYLNDADVKAEATKAAEQIKKNAQ